jgi:pyrroloquinoline-quinone synthase
MTDLKQAQDFSAEIRLRQQQDGVWLADNPFVERVATGRATRSEMGEWAKQFFCAIEFLHKLAHSRPKASLAGLKPEFKKFFWENRVEEQYGAISGTAGHLELLIQFGEAVGVARLEMVSARPNEATKRVMDWASTHVPAPEDFLMAQVVVGQLEAMNPAASTRLAEGCRKHYGLSDMQVRFFTVHIYADAEHGEVANQLLTLVPRERWPEIRSHALEQSRLFAEMWSSVVPRPQMAA